MENINSNLPETDMPASQAPASSMPDATDDAVNDAPGDATTIDTTELSDTPSENNLSALAARIEALEKRLNSANELISRAQQQGYIQGRNEKIENLTAQPPLWQQPDDSPDLPDPGILILDNIRPSVWD